MAVNMHTWTLFLIDRDDCEVRWARLETWNGTMGGQKSR